MSKRKTILISAEKIDETSRAIQRALTVLIGDQYEFCCSTFGEIKRRIIEIKSDIPKRILLQHSEQKISEVREKLSGLLEKEHITEKEKLEEQHLYALKTIQNTVQQCAIKMANKNRAGGSIQAKFMEALQKKSANYHEEKKRRSAEEQGAFAHTKEASLKEFDAAALDLKKDLHDLLNAVPAGADATLLEDLWQDIIAVWNQQLQSLKEYKGHSLTASKVSWENNAFLTKVESDAIIGLITESCLLIVVDINAQHRYDGIGFMRRYWAEILRYNHVPPPVIFLSFDSIQELVRQDKRNFVLHSAGIDVVTVPFSLESLQNRIHELADKRPLVHIAREYLRRSADLAAEGIIEHKWKNYATPYSLLRGAKSIGDIDLVAYQTLLEILQKGDEAAREEIFIYDATESECESRRSNLSQKAGAHYQLFSTLLAGKHILLIDDEAESSGLKHVLEALCGSGVVDTIHPEHGKKWADSEHLIADADIARLLISVDDLEQYDLVLLDMYLTEEDEILKKKYPHSKPPEGEFGGLRLLREMKKNIEFTVPVLMFTATTRLFNIKDAEKDIEGYIQKRACYHNNDEAIRYYTEFKESIENATGRDRTLLRYVWKYIREYDRKPEKSQEVVKYLESAFFSLKGYLREPRYPYLIGTHIMIGLAVECLWDERAKVHVYKHFNMRKDAKKIAMEDIYAYIAYQLRGDAAHAVVEKLTIADSFIAFYALLNALGIDTSAVLTRLKEPCALWTFSKDMVEAMIDSTCLAACPRSSIACQTNPRVTSHGIIPGAKCRSINSLPVVKANFLLYDNNFIPAASLKNQVLFKYLFFMLCLYSNDPGYALPPLSQYLLKTRFIGHDDFCPPFMKEQQSGLYYWVGKRDGERINSPLGILESGMFKDDIDIDAGQVLFRPTEKYLRGN